MTAIDRIRDLLRISESYGHNERFPWDRGYHEGYRDGLEVALKYLEQEEVKDAKNSDTIKMTTLENILKIERYNQ